MAVTTQIMMDQRYKTIAKYTCAAAANTNVSLLDVSTLIGYQAVTATNAAGGIVNLAKIYWTSLASVAINILFDATSNQTAFICGGTGGTYGYSPGQPAINVARAATGTQPPFTPSGALPGGITGDVLVTNASGTFTLVIEYHKVEFTIGAGNGWSGANP